MQAVTADQISCGFPVFLKNLYSVGTYSPQALRGGVLEVRAAETQLRVYKRGVGFMYQDSDAGWGLIVRNVLELRLASPSCNTRNTCNSRKAGDPPTGSQVPAAHLIVGAEAVESVSGEAQQQAALPMPRLSPTSSSLKRWSSVPAHDPPRLPPRPPVLRFSVRPPPPPRQRTMHRKQRFLASTRSPRLCW